MASRRSFWKLERMIRVSSGHIRPWASKCCGSGRGRQGRHWWNFVFTKVTGRLVDEDRSFHGDTGRHSPCSEGEAQNGRRAEHSGNLGLHSGGHYSRRHRPGVAIRALRGVGFEVDHCETDHRGAKIARVASRLTCCSGALSGPQILPRLCCGHQPLCSRHGALL